MKQKTLTLAMIFMIATTSVFSQSLKFGIKAGADINKITGKSFKEQFTFGYHAGAFAEIGLTSRFGIQPEVLFSQVSADTSSDFNDLYKLNNVSKVKLSYLKIPLLLNYKPNNFVSLQLGPQFGILLDQNTSIIQNGKDAFNKGDLSMLGGIQLNISKIRLYGRYAVGLNNIRDIDNSDKWKNQTVHLGVGFAL
jgi:hypothetical protein